MKRFTCRLQELDEETQEYLRLVYNMAGKRCPGMYLEAPPAPPFGKVAIFAGPVMMLLGIVWASSSTKSAYAVAMLFAGLMMLGGWLTWYGLRSVFRSKDDPANSFVYFDPNHVYQFDGNDVTVTEVAGYEKVRAKTESGVAQVVFTSQKETTAIPITNPNKGILIETYYNAILDLEDHEDSKWNQLPPIEMGGVAKHIAVEGGYPISVDSARLKVRDLPQQPSRDKPGVPGLGLIISYTAAAALFFVGLLGFKPMRDNSAFEHAKQTGAPGLRGYLMDERNTSHREEAKKLLADKYTPIIERVTATVADEHQEFRTGLVAILESLKTAPQPVVSLQVIETGIPNNPDEKESRERQLRESLADAFGLYVGHELIAFAKNPDDKKAHFELTYTLAANNVVHWKLAVRTTPESEAVSTRIFTVPGNASLTESVKNSVFMELFKQAAPVIPPPQFADDGW